MSDCIATFFDAWKIEEAELRLAKIKSSVTDTIKYDDPRTLETVSSIAALNDYVGCLLYTSPSPRDQRGSRMPSSA